MTTMLTSSPRQTLLLSWPRWQTLLGAAALAVVFHPVVNGLQAIVEHLYPVAPGMMDALKTHQEIFSTASLWQLVLLLGLLPAVCEEAAFRGFLLSGFRRLGHRWRAIALSALFFGITHVILQQSMITFVVGLVLGLVAVQSGSLLPGIVFHLLHNSLGLAMTQVTPELLDRWPSLRLLFGSATAERFTYPWQVIALGGISTLVLLAWFAYIPYAKSPEEEFEETLETDIAKCDLAKVEC